MSALRYGLQLGAAVFGLGLAAWVAPQLSPEAAADASADGATGVSTAAPAQGRAAAASVRSARTPAKVTAAAPVSRSAPAAASSVPTAAAPAGPRFRMLEMPASAAPRKTGAPAQELLGKVLGTHVTLINRTGKMIAVAQVPKGGRNDPEAETVFLESGKAGFYSGSNWGLFDQPDVRLRIYDVVIDSEGNAQRGVMSEIIMATNLALKRPIAKIGMDPYRVTTTVDTQLLNRSLEKWGFEEGQSWNADYRLQGPIQQDVYNTLVTRTYVERKGDSDDHKIFLIEVYAIPELLGTQDYESGNRVEPNM